MPINKNDGYSYDAGSRKITFITDGDGSGYSNINLSYESYYLSELTDSTMILSQSQEQEEGSNSDDNYTYLYKFIKQ